MTCQKELERNVISYLRRISSEFKGQPESERKKILGILESNIYRTLKTVPAAKSEAMRDDIPA